jgi:hypothetical protein
MEKVILEHGSADIMMIVTISGEIQRYGVMVRGNATSVYLSLGDYDALYQNATPSGDKYGPLSCIV